MPDLSLPVDLSNFSIRQQTAFNMVLIKHTALLLHDFFFFFSFNGVIFYVEQGPGPLKGSHVLQDLS